MTGRFTCDGQLRWVNYLFLPRAGNGGSIPPEDYLIPAPRESTPQAELNQWRRALHRSKISGGDGGDTRRRHFRQSPIKVCPWVYLFRMPSSSVTGVTLEPNT